MKPFDRAVVSLGLITVVALWATGEILVGIVLLVVILVYITTFNNNTPSAT